jgi:polyhydroxybutyrate depolymerase
MLSCRNWKSLQTLLLAMGLCSCSSSGGGNGSSSAGGGAASSSAAGGSGAGGTTTSSASGGASAVTSSRNGGAGAGGFAASGGKSSEATVSSGGTTGTTSAGGSTNSSAAGGRTGGGGGGTATGVSSATGGSTGGGAGGTSGRDAGAGGETGGAKSDAAAAGGTGGSEAGTCPAGATKPTDGSKSVTVGTTKRTYYLHVPAKYDGSKPAPLVVDYHGKGGNGSGEAGSNPYKSVIDAEGVLSAYPDGVNGDWNIGPCCNTYDDVAFAKALVQDVAKVACVDLKHVYAVGFSLGGGMVHRLGCEAADTFAAVAPAASDLVKETVDKCKPARPLTVISFRGTADSAVPYEGGLIVSFTGLGAQATFKKWAELDQCTGSPSAEDGNGCSTYSTCSGGVQVTLCSKKGGGHEPGNASISWPILKKFALP